MSKIVVQRLRQTPSSISAFLLEELYLPYSRNPWRDNFCPDGVGECNLHLHPDLHFPTLRGGGRRSVDKDGVLINIMKNVDMQKMMISLKIANAPILGEHLIFLAPVFKCVRRT